jgi:hypothetical protein
MKCPLRSGGLADEESAKRMSAQPTTEQVGAGSRLVLSDHIDLCVWLLLRLKVYKRVV